MEAKARLLVIDDHAVLRCGLNLLLNLQSDMTVVGETGRGSDAVSLCDALHPDVVLLDLSLPDLNGFDVLEQLKECCLPKVLVLTMYEDEAYAREVFKRHGNGYILKNAADTQLLSAIRAVCQGQTVVDPALTDVLMTSTRRSDDQELAHQGLSPREQEVLRLIALGYTNQQIASELVISIKTVESHKAHVKEKLNMSRRSDLVRYAMERGLLVPIKDFLQ